MILSATQKKELDSQLYMNWLERAINKANRVQVYNGALGWIDVTKKNLRNQLHFVSTQYMEENIKVCPIDWNTGETKPALEPMKPIPGTVEIYVY